MGCCYSRVRKFRLHPRKHISCKSTSTAHVRASKGFITSFFLKNISRLIQKHRCQSSQKKMLIHMTNKENESKLSDVFLHMKYSWVRFWKFVTCQLQGKRAHDQCQVTDLWAFGVLGGESGSNFVCVRSTTRVVCSTTLLKPEDAIIEGRADLRMNHHLFYTTESRSLSAGQQLLRPFFHYPDARDLCQCIGRQGKKATRGL